VRRTIATGCDASLNYEEPEAVEEWIIDHNGKGRIARRKKILLASLPETPLAANAFP
jgi:hypothetical protein